MKASEYRICFLILHYRLVEVTAACVDSILSLDGGEQVPVLIVDNASLNGSGEALQERYGKNGNVHVMILKEGKGFSHANNLGYRYCQEHFEFDLIVIANNDIVFFQREFLFLVKKCFQETRFDIMGPDIVTRSRRNQEAHGNPRFSNRRDMEGVKKGIQECENYLKRPGIHYIKSQLKLFRGDLMEMVKGPVKKLLHYKGRQVHARSAENVELWGACLIFSSEYGRKREYPFYPETFFYQEENILFYHARKMKMKTYYDAQIKVFHESERTTRDKYKNRREKEKFTKRCDLEGLKLLLSLMEEDEKNRQKTFN